MEFFFFVSDHWLAILVTAIVAYLVGSTINIARQYERTVVFRLGKYVRTAGPGLYLLIPVLEHANVVDMRTITIQDLKQASITKDNVPVTVNVVIWFKIVQAMESIVKVENVRNAILQLSLSQLRNKIGQHNLDETLKNQDSISKEMLETLKAVAAEWGVEIEGIQMKNVEIPESMQRAMAQEAEALREKRARVIKAEGEMEAAKKLNEAAELIMKNPAALELRRMQMITEVGAEQNTSTIIMFPSEFVAAAGGLADMARRFSPAAPAETPKS